MAPNPITPELTPRTQALESARCELRLFLEEICCDLCRFEHDACGGACPESVQIDREFYLGAPGAFADIRIQPPGEPAYFVEVKYGYPTDKLISHLNKKYSPQSAGSAFGSKIILVVDLKSDKEKAALVSELTRKIHPSLEVELWDEQRLLRLIRDRLGVPLEAISPENLLSVRQAVDTAKGFHAFGGDSLEQYIHDPLKAELLWHFGFWRLRHLRESGRPAPRNILPPGTYRGVAVLLADLCSFSSYVRDTPDCEILRESLTSFYSKARYQIINHGGMLYQFVGDEVVGIFGMPETDENYAAKAISTARGLVALGESVSNHWQRRIDRVQTAGGLHVGVAVGDLEVVSLRPFSRTHVGVIGDCINVAARLMSSAGQSEIAVSNSLFRLLPEHVQERFQEMDPIEAKNIGRIKAWKLSREECMATGRNGTPSQ